MFYSRKLGEGPYADYRDFNGPRQPALNTGRSHPQQDNYMTPRDTERDALRKNLMDPQKNAWHRKFMHMAIDLYKMDDYDQKVGYLPLDEARECCLRHNRIEGLGLDTALIDNCLSNSRKGGYIDIDVFLNKLSDVKIRDRIN